MRASQWMWIIVAALGWGSGGLGTRAAFEEGVGAWTMVAVQAVVAALLVLIVLIARRSAVPTRAVLRLGLIQAIFGLSIPFVLFTFAYNEASAGFVGLLTALAPLSTAIFAAVMLKNEPLTKWKLIALLVAFSGVAALMFSGDSGLSEGGRPLVAIGLALTAVATIGYTDAFAKRYAGTYDPVMMTGLQFGISAVWLVIAMVAIDGLPTDVSRQGWTLMLGMGIFSSFMPFVLFFWLLRSVSVGHVSLVGYLVPFVTLIGGIVLLGEELQGGIIIGGVLVFSGMVMADRAGRHLHTPTVVA